MNAEALSTDAVCLSETIRHSIQALTFNLKRDAVDGSRLWCIQVSMKQLEGWLNR